jgi:hypothetical protein
MVACQEIKKPAKRSAKFIGIEGEEGQCGPALKCNPSQARNAGPLKRIYNTKNK